jgi:hypothetical protein
MVSIWIHISNNRNNVINDLEENNAFKILLMSGQSRIKN